MQTGHSIVERDSSIQTDSRLHGPFISFLDSVWVSRHERKLSAVCQGSLRIFATGKPWIRDLEIRNTYQQACKRSDNSGNKRDDAEGSCKDLQTWTRRHAWFGWVRTICWSCVQRHAATSCIHPKFQPNRSGIWGVSCSHFKYLETSLLSFILFLRIIAVGFYFVLFCIVLACWHIDPLALFLSVSSVIIAFSFAIGRSCANYIDVRISVSCFEAAQSITHFLNLHTLCLGCAVHFA